MPSARNIGIENSDYDIIGFLDDDCFPLKNNWIKRAHKWFKHKNRKIIGVAGPVFNRFTKPILYNKQRVKKTIGRIRKIFPKIISNFNQTPTKPIIVETLPGGNMFLKKIFVESYGGFDPQFDGNHYREETDLCMKLKNNSLLVFDPKLPINHLRVDYGCCRVAPTQWYISVISNTLLLILKNWGNPIEMLSGTSTYFLELIYECTKVMEDQRYYRIGRYDYLRSIFKGFWGGIKKFFIGSKKLQIKKEMHSIQKFGKKSAIQNLKGLKAY